MSENTCFRKKAFNSYDQVTKGAWRMSWHQKAKKGVEVCDKLRRAGKQALIRRFPNYLYLNT